MGGLEVGIAAEGCSGTDHEPTSTERGALLGGSLPLHAGGASEASDPIGASKASEPAEPSQPRPIQPAEPS